jgi:hypothetical protein
MGQDPDAVQSVYDVLHGQAPIDRVHAAFAGAAQEALSIDYTALSAATGWSAP